MFKPGDRVKILWHDLDDGLPRVNGKLGTVVTDDRASHDLGMFVEVDIDDTPRPISADEGWLFLPEELEHVDA
jgi:hypothetical protein